MNYLKIIFKNIETFYEINEENLLKNDKLRPAKSIPRDIFSSVEKFKNYYLNTEEINITATTIQKSVLDIDSTKDENNIIDEDKITDTTNTNIRLMKELEFLEQFDDNFKFTKNFLDFINGSVSIEDYFLSKLKNIYTIDDFKMIYNLVICTLREGYLNGKIVSFPDSKKVFEEKINSLEQRINYCEMVEKVYGFHGRNKNPKLAEYTPNANYRATTILSKLNLINIVQNSNFPLTQYELTEEAILLLQKINNNLGKCNNNIIQNPTNLFKPLKFAYNRIIFGAPGTGKSHKLDDDKQIFGDNFERVTFHPNYSYAQFVGTYKPVPIKEIDENGKEKLAITYKYVPGPFMRTYVKAIKSLKSDNPKPFLLLIEEINRANVASVFGDVFQLLDRKNGVSEYEIEASEDMKDYLVNELGGVKEYYEKIKIPANMYIWATMNSADQGVFPMDTAFKRRWEFEYIDIDENSSGIQNIKVMLGSGNNAHEVNWNELRMAINKNLSNDCKVNEDKLIGPYFLSKDVIKVDETTNFVEDNDKFIKAFKSKVIMYLYEDAAKQHKQKIFEGCDDFSRYSSVCKKFDEIGEEIFGLNLSTGSTEE